MNFISPFYNNVVNEDNTQHKTYMNYLNTREHNNTHHLTELGSSSMFND